MFKRPWFASLIASFVLAALAVVFIAISVKPAAATPPPSNLFVCQQSCAAALNTCVRGSQHGPCGLLEICATDPAICHADFNACVAACFFNTGPGF